VLGLIAGSTAAGAVHVTKAKLRIASTATTAGAGNPFLSILEDVAALVGTLSALVVPLIMLLLMIVAVVLAWMAIRRWRRRAHAGQSLA
jgi:hypothetical protein